MNVDETEPISKRTVDPWKILACVSTVVSVATIATLVWTVNKVSDEPTPAERMSAPVAVTETIEPAPAPQPPQPEPIAQTSNSIDWSSPLNQYFPMAASAPAPAIAPPPPPAGMPVWPAVNLPAPNIMVNPGFSIDAIIGAVTGAAGWVGGGTLNLLGDAIVASAMNNQRPTDPLAALAAPLTRIPPPQWPRELDVTKIPPPQWPRELDITKIPPPHVHWDRLLPRF